MNDTTQESQALGYILMILPNIGLHDFRVQRQECIDVARLCKNVHGMPQLGCLNHDCPFEFKNIFVTKQVDSSGAARELIIEKGIVIRTPTDLSNIEVAGDA